MKIFRQYKNGFTLVELMIVVLIVGILSTVVYNSYSSQSMRARRSDAQTKLFEIMQRQERYMSENNTYTTDLTNLGYATNPLVSDNQFYSITATAGTNGIADGVLIKAAPQNAQSKDTKCGTLILNSTGQKTTSTGATTNCW